MIYGNCCVFSPDNLLMFRCEEKRINWYLERNLAEKISENPLSIKLNFQPNGLGNRVKGYGLLEMSNKCVNCGNNEELSRHHVVPICYRKHFPEKFKSRYFHDVLAMCKPCHYEYEAKAQKLKKEIAREYDVGEVKIKENKEVVFGLKSAKILINEMIPKGRRDEVKRKLKEYFGIKRLTRKRVEEFLIKKKQDYDPNPIQSQIIASKIEDIQRFIKRWRQHFLDNNSCKFLPEGWSVDYEQN